MNLIHEEIERCPYVREVKYENKFRWREAFFYTQPFQRCHMDGFTFKQALMGKLNVYLIHFKQAFSCYLPYLRR
jgi:hypothetical protein